MSHQTWIPLAPARVSSSSASESPAPGTSGDETDYVMAETMLRHRVPKLVTIMENHTAYAKAFNLGQIVLDQVVFRWRRMVLTILFRRLWYSKDAIMSAYSVPGLGQAVGDCAHPMEARRKGGNRYGQNTHCVMCHKRIEYVKFPEPLKGKKS